MRISFCLFFALGVRAAGTNSTFVPGAVCADVTPTTLASDILRGKHLVVNDLDWAPFSEPLPDGSWRGIDMDILSRLGAMLNFTYEFRLHSKSTVSPPASSWTDLLKRDARNADLTAGYWTHTGERFDHVLMLKGHLDLSAVLISRKEVADEEYENEAALQRLGRSFFSFLKPFQAGLWIAVIFLIFFSSAVDFVIERMRMPEEARFSSSCFEFSAGSLWGGFADPLSRTSAVYQVLIGGIFLILISGYTAELATFMIVAKQAPPPSVQSMDHAQLHKSPICRLGGSIINERVERMWPRVALGGDGSRWPQADKLVASEGCDGLLSTMVNFKGYKTRADYCSLQMQEILFPQLGGWATNRQSECVATAIGYGLTLLDISGEIDSIIDSFYEPAPCSQGTTTGTDGDEGMSFYDVAGLFVIWLVFSIFMVTMECCRTRAWRRAHGDQVGPRSIVGAVVDAVSDAAADIKGDAKGDDAPSEAPQRRRSFMNRLPTFQSKSDRKAKLQRSLTATHAVTRISSRQDATWRTKEASGRRASLMQSIEEVLQAREQAAAPVLRPSPRPSADADATDGK
jgi:hypothetical protein